jgi:hypothetical protein
MLVPNIFNGINIYKLNAYAKHRPTWRPVSHIITATLAPKVGLSFKTPNPTLLRIDRDITRAVHRES